MGLRRFERSLVKHRCIERDGHAGNFKEEWQKYHDDKMKSRQENNANTVVRAKHKRKKHHFDNGRVAIRRWKMLKEMLANEKKITKKKKKKNN